MVAEIDIDGSPLGQFVKSYPRKLRATSTSGFASTHEVRKNKQIRPYLPQNEIDFLKKVGCIRIARKLQANKKIAKKYNHCIDCDCKLYRTYKYCPHCGSKGSLYT